MIRHTFTIVASATLMLPISAFAADKPPICESPEGGANLIACAAARHEKADAELNATYRQLRDAMRKRGEHEAAVRLQHAQRDWLKFQQSHCELESTYEGAGGSFISSKLGDCMAITTADRAKYLQELLLYFK